MKRSKRAALSVLCLLMLVQLIGCGAPGTESSEEPSVDNFPYYQKKTEFKEDGPSWTPEGVEFPASLWETPEAQACPELDRGGVKGWFIRSLNDTWVFCYVGLPEGADAEDPVPAVVLIHGATGTAFWDWVEAWNKRGYAAIAMDTEGRMPTPETSTYHAVFSESTRPHGPVNASFTDCGKPVGEQWVYHALASVIASTSFLRSFPEVDNTRIGITGVSYGGFLTCLAVGIDDRTCFAAPVYGCLSNAVGAGEFGSYINGNPGAELWDGTGSLAAARTPVLFVNSDTDNHFTADSVTRSTLACQNAAITLIPGLEHGHAQGAEVREVFAFADEICRGGTPLVRVLTRPENNEMEIAVPKGVTLTEVRQRYTVGETLSSATEWLEDTAEVDQGFVFFSTEDFKKYFYLSLKDDRGYYVSSQVV